MPTSETKPRWQRRADARPQELIDAALHVFVERGYSATRLEEVAQRAGVSKGTLYLYFENKAELFKAVVRSALISNLSFAETQMAHYEGSSKDLLSLFVRTFTQRVAGSALSGIPKLVMAEAGNFPEIARFYYDEVILRGEKLVRGLLERGIARGEFRALDTEYAWRIVIAPLILGILWKHSFQIFAPDSLDFDRHLQAHLDVLFNGLDKPASARSKQ